MSEQKSIFGDGNIVPVNIKYHDEYCKKLKNILLEEDIRVSYDNSEERMGKKIRRKNEII